DIDFLVGDEAFERHAAGFVTMRVPVVEYEGIDVDQLPLTEGLRVIEDGVDRGTISEGVPIAPVDASRLMKLIAGRTQDLADIEALIESGADRESLRAAVRRAAPARLETLERFFGNVDRMR